MKEKEKADKIRNEEKTEDERPSKKSKKCYYLCAVVALIAAVVVGYNYKKRSPYIFDRSQAVSHEVFSKFQEFDTDNDGYLSMKEFELAYALLTKITPSDSGLNIAEVELQNFHVNVQEELSTIPYNPDDKVLTLRAQFIPMDQKTMTKFQNDQYDSDSLIHLKGLNSWLQPNIEIANFPAANFSIFLPPNNGWRSKKVGDTWDLISKVLGGRSGSYFGEHLAGNRYLPPNPETNTEQLLLYILSMFHSRAFLHMRFPPRGSVACLKAINQDYYTISFRIHAEFQLNEPPLFPFWFTPASFIGEIIIKKDGTHIQYFDLKLSTRKQLNIDMEWMTSPPKTDGSHGQEVDIGFCPLMRITSTEPSTTLSELSNSEEAGNEPIHPEEKVIVWDEILDDQAVFDIMEQDFYPFKKIPYLDFNKTFERAVKEKKLIHHITLWGALDDQSC